MRPWEAEQRGRRPDDSELRQHVADGLSDGAIGDMFGVSRFTVAEWRKKANPVIEPAVKRTPPVSHKEHMPWKLSEEHIYDPIARRLRAYSRMVQGAKMSDRDRRLAERFAEAVKEAGVVIAYTPERGFYRVRRDVNRDRPDLLVRTPTT